MKKWNQAATAALLTAFVMTGALPAYAEEPTQPATATKTETATGTKPVPVERQKPQAPAGMIQEEQAIAKARELFGGLANLKFAQAYYDDRADYISSEAVWSVNFSVADMSDPKVYEQYRKQGPMHSVHAYIDAKTGELLQFQEQHPDWVGEGAPEEAQALQAADTFMKKMMKPEELAKLSKPVANRGRSGTGYADENGKSYVWMSSEVEYCELVNGIPFRSNAIHVGIDQYGHVVSYRKSFRFDSSKLPKPEGIVSKEVATVGYANEMKMNLSYQTRTMNRTKDGDYEFKDNPVLSYSPNGMATINAFTGKPANQDFQMVETERTTHKLTGQGKTLTAKTKEEAGKIISDLLGIDLSKLVYSEPHKSPFHHTQRDQVTQYDWREDYAQRPQDVKDNWQPMYVSAAFDTKTGQLLSVNRNGEPSHNAPAFTLEEGTSKALEILKQYAPQREQELLLTYAQDSREGIKLPSWFDSSKGDNPNSNSEARFSYGFSPTYQGIPISDLSYSVSLNPENGKLISLSLPNLKDVKLPDSKNAVDPAVTEATFIQNHPLALQYVWNEFFNQRAPEGQLVYEMDWNTYKFSYIDALTGREVGQR